MRGLILPLALILSLVARPALAQVTPADAIPQPRIENGRVAVPYAPLLAELRRGGLVFIIRHERTDLSSRWDTADHRPQGDCARERNLSSVGREGAWTLGEALRILGVPIGIMIVSPFCRAIETARLAFRRVDIVSPAVVGPDGEGRTYDTIEAELTALIARHGRPDANLMIVGHGGTILAYTDAMLDEGETLVLRPRRDASPEVVGRMPAARWDELVRDLQRQAAGI